MKKSRKKYDAKYKAKVAIEAIKERETLSELAAKYGVSPVMISRWKKEFIENSLRPLSHPSMMTRHLRSRRTGTCGRLAIWRCSWILQSGYPENWG